MLGSKLNQVKEYLADYLIRQEDFDDFYISTLAAKVIIYLAYKKKPTDKQIADLIAIYLEFSKIEILLRHALELLVNF